MGSSGLLTWRRRVVFFVLTVSLPGKQIVHCVFRAIVSGEPKPTQAGRDHHEISSVASSVPSRRRQTRVPFGVGWMGSQKVGQADGQQ